MPLAVAMKPMPTRANPASHPVTIDDPITITRSMSSRFTLEITSRQSAVGFLVFFAGALGDIVRQRGRGRLLVPMNGFQIIANELLIVGRLCAAGRISLERPKAR